MPSYKIKGTLGINYKGKETDFTLYPDSAYLCPEHKNAVLYPSGLQAALIEPLTNNQVSLSLKDQKLEALLTQLALQSKTLELIVEQDNQTLKITGLNYPAN